ESTLVSSSLTRPRQKSDEITSVALKCLRAKELLPEPDAPISTTSESSGIRSSRASATGEDSHLRRRAHRGVLGPDGQEAHRVSDARGDSLRSRAKLRSRPFEAVIAVSEAARR